MNTVSLIGRTTKDIEVRYTPAGKAVCNFSIAIGRKYTKPDGEKVEETSFIDIQCWGHTAENVQKYVKKGNRIAVIGSLKQDRWEDNGQKRSKLYVNAQQVEFLETKPKEQEPKTEEEIKPENVSWAE